MAKHCFHVGKVHGLYKMCSPICKLRFITVCSVAWITKKVFREFVHGAVMRLLSISELGYISVFYFWSLLICIPVPLLLLVKPKHYISLHSISLLATGQKATGVEFKMSQLIINTDHCMMPTSYFCFHSDHKCLLKPE